MFQLSISCSRVVVFRSAVEISNIIRFVSLCFSQRTLTYRPNGFPVRIFLNFGFKTLSLLIPKHILKQISSKIGVSFIHSGDLYIASSRDYYSEAMIMMMMYHHEKTSFTPCACRL